MGSPENIYAAVYLQHGEGEGPFRAESVPFRRRVHSESYTKRGHIRSFWQVQYGGRWRWIMLPDCGPSYVVIGRKRVGLSYVKTEDAA